MKPFAGVVLPCSSHPAIHSAGQVTQYPFIHDNTRENKQSVAHVWLRWSRIPWRLAWFPVLSRRGLVRFLPRRARPRGSSCPSLEVCRGILDQDLRSLFLCFPDLLLDLLLALQDVPASGETLQSPEIHSAFWTFHLFLTM